MVPRQVVGSLQGDTAVVGGRHPCCSQEGVVLLELDRLLVVDNQNKLADHQESMLVAVFQ